MTDSASPSPGPDPTGTGPDLDESSGTAGIDPENTEVVPALTGLVTSARATYRTMAANPGCYPAIMAVGAVEDTVATLALITYHLELYVGDHSGEGGKAAVRAHDLLRQARAALSDARHHLALDDATQPFPAPPAPAGAGRPLTAHVGRGTRLGTGGEPSGDLRRGNGSS